MAGVGGDRAGVRKAVLVNPVLGEDGRTPARSGDGGAGGKRQGFVGDQGDRRAGGSKSWGSSARHHGRDRAGGCGSHCPEAPRRPSYAGHSSLPGPGRANPMVSWVDRGVTESPGVYMSPSGRRLVILDKVRGPFTQLPGGPGDSLWAG